MSPAPRGATAPVSVFDESHRTAPHVTIRGLSKRYTDATIYDNFDFDIPRHGRDRNDAHIRSTEGHDKGDCVV